MGCLARQEASPAAFRGSAFLHEAVHRDRLGNVLDLLLVHGFETEGKRLLTSLTTLPEMQMPPGSASGCSCTDALTPSP